MDYLKMENLLKGNVITYNGESLELIAPAGAALTVVNESNDNNKKGVDRKAMVFIRQRWKVDILPKDNFSKRFRTHRKLEVYYCLYEELLREQERIYTSKEVIPRDIVDTNELGDDFGNIF